jgi:RNA polymerase sigma-70 factor, ECF subfamily
VSLGPDDSQLVAAALSGERAAEEQLYRRHAPAVLALATRLLRRSADAEDVAQDAFVSAFERLSQLSEPALFRRWLLRIAVSHAHRRFRRQKLLRVLGLDRSSDDASLSHLALPGLAAEQRAELARIDQALAQLAVADRSAFVLRYVEGYELSEAAELSGCSLATFKRRLKRAQDVVHAHVGRTEP